MSTEDGDPLAHPNDDSLGGAASVFTSVDDSTPSHHFRNDSGGTAEAMAAQLPVVTENDEAPKKNKRLCRYPGCQKVIKSQGHCQVRAFPPFAPFFWHKRQVFLSRIFGIRVKILLTQSYVAAWCQAQALSHTRVRETGSGYSRWNVQETLEGKSALAVILQPVR